MDKKISDDKVEEAIKHGRNGQMTPPGSTQIDSNPLEVVPLMVTTENSDVVTMSPHPMPDATSKYYKNKVVWLTRHNDGSIKTEYDRNGVLVNSQDIDHGTLREFCLIDYKGRVVISQEINPGQYFFYRKRTALQTGKDVVEAMHMFGWRIPIDGECDQLSFLPEIKSVHDHNGEWHIHLCVLYESDMHVELGDFDYTLIDPSADISGHRSWKYPIKWRNIDCIRTT